MSGDEINGETDAMKRFSSNLLGSFEQNPVPQTVRRGQIPPCDCGRDDCSENIEADNKSSESLHQCITGVKQGFAGYSSFMHCSAAEYLRAGEDSRKQILSALERERPL